MELCVVGCHGGETPKHRTSAFVLDGRLAIDAGSLTSGLDLKAQVRLEAVLVSHAHLDHIRDLATIADNRFQAQAAPLKVVGLRPTLAALKKHFFNNFIWPDFSKIPTHGGFTIEFVEIRPDRPLEVAGYQVRAIPVTHSIDTAGFVVSNKRGSLAYSGDTGPTDRLWEVIAETPNLKALLLEVSFPNREQGLATLSGHHTPRTAALDLKKLERPADLPTILYHMKPVFQRELEQECARLKGLNLEVARLEQKFKF
jgi:cAMP phosphodiesterase